MTNDHRRLDEETVQGILLDDPDFLHEIVERVLQELLEAEMTQHIGAAPHERTNVRKGHRNGYKPRTLRTRVGTLNLLVPQDREGTFSTRLFSRYQRNEKALVLALMEMYVEGVSTRKVKEVTEELCGTSFSKSLVSSLAGSLDLELQAWRMRRLEAKAYPYLFVDARYEKVRVDGRVVSQGVLLVSGVRDEGFREILGVEVADTESEATYQEMFRSLKARGLLAGSSSGGLRRSPGPQSRHGASLPGGKSWQRCQVHYARNLLGMVGHARRKELSEGLCEGSSPHRAGRWPCASRFGAGGSVARKPSQDRGASRRAHRGVPLTCLAFPESHRRPIRTTNGLERFNQEIKRRTRVVRIFPNREACLRLVTALAVEQSEEWLTGRRYLGICASSKSSAVKKSREQRRWRSWSSRGRIGLGGNYRNFGT